MENCTVMETLMRLYDKQESLLKTMGRHKALELSIAEDASLRSWVAKSLVWDAKDPFAAQLLCQLARDDDMLVRVEALDSLSASRNHNWIPTFRHALGDSEELVRMYAAIGLAEVCQGQPEQVSEAQTVLQRALALEENCHARIGILEGLYVLGQRNMLTELFRQLDNSDYHIRCAVLNTLDSILDRENREQIGAFLHSLDLSEEVAAVSSTVARLLKRCSPLQESAGTT